MPAPSTIEEFLDLVRKSGVVDEKRLSAHLDRLRATGQLPSDPVKLATLLMRDGVLTHFQAEQFLQGKWRRFTIGKYKVLERLGSGGMGSVYLCEHMLMRRRVAVKVLPASKAEDSSSLERFYREARAVAALDHPNIVRAYDIDQDDNLHFLVMEHVDGSSLQEIIKRIGPMDVTRATHYIRQASLGLQHAHEAAGLVHRDIKPGNILVDRNGIVKVLDMGLARFFHDEEDVLTKKYDENVLGTADYLAPEQALDSHSVDIRADIYSLGGTFYYCLTGRTPFNEGTIAQKLIWHQPRQPKPIRLTRPEVPEGIVAVLDKMMAKDPNHRHQTPLEVADALFPWTQTPIPPPPENEMPQFSLAATMTGPTTVAGMKSPRPSAESALVPQPSRKSWQVTGAPPPSTATTPQAEASTRPTIGPATPRPNVQAPAAPPTPARPAPAPQQPAAANPAPRPTVAPPVTPPAPARPPTASAPVASPATARAEANKPNSTQQAAAANPAAQPSPRPSGNGPARATAMSDDRTPVLESYRERDDDQDVDREEGMRLPRRELREGRRRSGPAKKTPNRTLLWVLIAVGALLLLGGGTLAYFLIGSGSKKSPPRPVIRVPGTRGLTLQAAVIEASEGTRIIIESDIRECMVAVTKKRNITIEAESGKTITWKCPPGAAPVGIPRKRSLLTSSC